MKFKTFTLLLCSVYIKSFSQQEEVVPLLSNPLIKDYVSVHGTAGTNRMVGVNDTVHLPFIDDFSSTEVYPDMQKWQDKAVFINSSYARNMPTVGVATFDGLNELGDAYSPGNSVSGRCDTLTSQPLFLYTKPGAGGLYSLADSLYISFFYQKKGYGDAPDNSDSLVLDFYKPATNAWSKFWFTKGGVTAGQDTTFIRVDLVIADSAFLQDGFRFRFRNYGNVSGMYDHWHVDYVRLFSKTNTGSLDIIDRAFADRRIPILNNYTSIPWTHYKSHSSPASLIPATANDYCILYANTSLSSGGIDHRCYDMNGNLVGSLIGGSNSYNANQRLLFSFPVNYIYPQAAPEISYDSSYFDIADSINIIQVGNDASRSNDVVRHRQYFYNYYSYDDGSAELAYDLVNAANSKLAMKFDLLQADTLRAVQLYFGRQGAIPSNPTFALKVWSSLSPETVLYQETGLTPKYTDSINGYALYQLAAPILVSGSIYIGTQQVGLDGLHLGFDRNNTNNSRMFYNISGTWTNVSAADGTFMIRPLVSDAPLFVGVEEKNTNYTFHVYPNPVNTILHIQNSGELITEKLKLEIFDITGQLIVDKPFDNMPVDVSKLTPGIYIARMSNDEINSTVRFTLTR